jgi:hypothetical protein
MQNPFLRCSCLKTKGDNMNRMSVGQELIERRKHKRYKVKDVSFAVRSNLPEEELVQIVDISKGGLAFDYYLAPGQLDPSMEIDIILADNELHIDNLSITPVSDFSVENSETSSGVNRRRRGLQFASLTVDQLSKLEFFIQNHTIAAA